MRNIVFKVETEYHLLLSTIIIFKNFANTENYSCYIITNEHNKRIRADINEESIPAKFVKLSFNVETIKNDINLILNLKPTRFFYFQEIDAINIFLVDKLYRSNCIIALVQDGLKPYVTYKKKYELLSALRDTYLIYKNIINFKLPFDKIKILWFYKYGQLKEVKELWLTHPDSFDNKFNKRLVKIESLNEYKITNVISKLFNYDCSQCVIPSSNVILYINQPLWNSTLVEEEIYFLNKLLKRINHSKNIFIKLHPLTPEKTINKYSKIKHFRLLKYNYPAELLISSLINSIIISGWSSALLFNNSACDFYYIFPIFPKDKILSQLNLANPTSHIKVVESENDINVSRIF